MTSLLMLVLRWPRTFALGFTLTTVVAAAGLSRSWTDVGYRVFLGADHPAIRSLDGLIERFGGGLPILIAWECGERLPCKHALDSTALQMAHEIEEALLDHDRVRSVASPSSADVLVPGAGSLEIRHLVEDGEIAPDAEVLISRVRNDPLWLGTLLSHDGLVGAIVVQLSSTESRASAEVVPFIRDHLARYEALGHRFHLVGDPIDFVVSGGQMQADTPPIMIGLVGALIVTSWLLLRSWRAVALALITAGSALLWAMGAMAWLGWPEMELTQALRPGILVVALCDAIHLIARYSEQSSRSGQSAPEQRRTTLLHVVRAILLPCFLTSLTTFVAFLSFVLSGSDAFIRFGVIAALGVAIAFALTFTALPLAMYFIDPRTLGPAHVQRDWTNFLDRVAGFSDQRRRPILVCSLVAFCVSAIGIAWLRIDLNERELVGETSVVSRWASFVEQHLRKSDSLELILRTPSETTILDPASLETVAGISAAISDLDSIGSGRSIVDLFSALNRSLHNDTPDYFHPASTSAGNSELLLLLEMGGGVSSDLWLYEEREARVSFEADPLSTSERIETLERIEAVLSTELPAGWAYEISGPFSVYLAFVDVIQRTQLASFGSAFLIISSILFIYLRRETRSSRSALRWTSIAMLPSVLPVFVILGLMGILDIPLDVGTAMVGAIIIGIAVDDSIHLISAFHACRSRETSDRKAIATAIHQTGQAVVTSSVALSAGFFSLTLSSWQSIASFGLLSGLAIIVALIADLVLLPALVVVTSGDGTRAKDPDRPVTGIPGRKPRGVVTACSLSLAIMVVWSILDTLSLDLGGTPLGCQFEASGRVLPLSTLSTDCPLSAGDVIQSVRVGEITIDARELSELSVVPGRHDIPSFRIADRATHERTRDVDGVPLGSRTSIDPLLAVLLVVLTTGGGLIVTWFSASQACLPFALVSASVGGLAALTMSTAATKGSVVPFCLVLATFAASALHLGLSFPRRSRVMEDIHGLWWLIYLCGAVIGAAALWGSMRHPALWRAALVLASLCGGLAIGKLIANSVRAGVDRDHLDDTRARTAVVGLLLLAGGLLISWLTTGDLEPTAIAVGLAAMPAPIGYALIRHQHFTSRLWWRKAIERILTSVFYIPSAVLFLSWLGSSRLIDTGLPRQRIIATAVMALILALICRLASRALIQIFLPHSADRLSSLESAAAALLESAKDSSDAGRTLAQAATQGIRASSVSVALVRDGQLSVVAACGTCPILPSQAESIHGMLAHTQQLLHLGPEGGATGDKRDLLFRNHIAIVAALRWDDELLGAVFAGSAADGFPYSRDDLCFVERLCRSAAAVIHHLDLQSHLLVAERRVALSSAGSGLMHSVSKPLTIAARSAELLVLRRPHDEDVRALAGIIRTAANEALYGIERLRASVAADSVTMLVCPVEELIDRAIERAHQLHPGRAIVKRLSPDLPLVDHSDDLRRMVTSLLDNSLHASQASDPPPEVRTHARRDGLLIEVVDFGAGMTPEILARATEPFFTTRRDSGGSGIGLMDVVATVERLGGDFELESTPGQGTTATLRLPYAEDGSPAETESALQLASGQ